MRSFHRKLVPESVGVKFLSFGDANEHATREAPAPARGSKNEGKRQRQRQFFASLRSYFPRSLSPSPPFSRRDGPSVVFKLWFGFSFFSRTFLSFLFIGKRTDEFIPATGAL